MPRGRMLNKKISRDEKVAKLSLKATLLFTFCIPFLDFRGRIYADPFNLKSICPFIKEITIRNIPKIIQEWVAVDLVTYYGDNAHKYLEFKGFLKNQTLREGRESESEIPPPTPAELQRNSSGTPAKVKLSKVKIREDKIDDRKSKDFRHLVEYFVTECETIKGYKPELPAWSVIGSLIHRRRKTISDEEIKELMDFYLNSDKSKKWGGSIKVALSNATVNEWQETSKNKEHYA